MNPYKLFGLIFILLLSIVSVNAALTDTIVSYWKLDENTGTTATDSVGNNDGTISGPTWTTGKINSGLNFDGTNDEITSSINPTFTNTGSSISVWVYPTSNTANSYIINSPSSPNKFTLIWFPTSTTYNGFAAGIATSGTASSTTFATSSSTASINNWYHIVATNDGSITRLYINGVLIDTATASTITNIQDLCVGSSCGNNYFQGKIDEPAIWDRALTQTEITELYNSGNGLQYPFTEPILSFANISVNDETLTNNNYFSSTELNFFIEVFNTSTNGIIAYSYDLYYENMTFIDSNVYPNEGLTKSFSLTGLEEAKYFIQIEAENNETNVSENYYITIDLTPPTINNNIPAEINSYTFSPNSSCDYIGGGYCNISIDGQDIALNSSTITLTHNGNISYTITAQDDAGNLVTEEGFVFVNPIVKFKFVDEEGGQIYNFTFGGVEYEDLAEIKIYSLGLGNHTLTFEKLGFGITNITFNFTDTQELNDTKTIKFARININIYDRESFDLLTSSAEVFLITDTNQFNYTTSNGTLSLISDDLTGDNSLRISSTGYKTEYFDFDFTNKEILNLNFYLLDENKSSLIVVFVKKGSLNLNNAVVTAQQFVNNSKEVVTTATTNEDGVALLNLQEENVWYDICVTYDLFYKCINNKIISEYEVANGILITFSIEDLVQLSSDDMYLYNIWGKVSIINQTNSSVVFEAEYSDPDMYYDEYCLFVYEGNISSNRSLISENCITSKPNGKIGYNGTSSKELLAVLKAKKGDSYLLLDSQSSKTKFNLEGILGAFTFGILLLCFFGLLLFPGEELNIKEISVFLIMIFVVIMQRVFEIWGEGVSLGMVILGLVVIMLMRRSE